METAEHEAVDVGHDDAPPSTQQVIDAAAEGRKLEPEQAMDALEFFLSDEGKAALEQVPTHTLELNFGGPVNEAGLPQHPDRPPRYVRWTVSPIEESVITRLFRDAAGGGAANRSARRARRGASADENTNLRIVAAGTIDPDPAEVARRTGMADPALAMKHWFRLKPGLITTVADAILELSGFNDDDVRDAREVKAIQG